MAGSLSWAIDVLHHPTQVTTDGVKREAHLRLCSYIKMKEDKVLWWCPHKASFLLKVKDKEEIHLVCVEHYKLIDMNQYSYMQYVE